MNKWTELRTAYQVARLGTVSAAAQTLGLHRATINRHIDILEADIGAKIFLRHARGYALTEVGHDVLRVAKKADELIEDLAGRVLGAKAEIAGEIKLTILAPFTPFLMPAIADFRLKNPRCVVNIDVGEDLARLEFGEAHIALRAGTKPDHPDYVVSRFGEFGFNLYAHESYVARNGLPSDSHDLAGHAVVLPSVPEGRSPFADWIKEHVCAEMIALASRDVAVTVDAILAGIGMGFMSDFEASQRSDLHAVFPPNPAWSVPGWIVTHIDLHRTEKVQAMLGSIKSFKPVT